jgi:predicted component of type VI protein secretion system
MTPQQQRERILQILYEEPARDSLQALESEELAQRVDLPWDRIRLEVSYLEEKGYIVSKNRSLGTRLLRTFYLTAKGVDLLEGRVSDGAVAQVIYVNGDWVQTQIGDHARGVAAGKEITQQKSTAEDRALIERLCRTLGEFLDYLDEEEQSLLASEEVTTLKKQVTELTEALRKVGLPR